MQVNANHGHIYQAKIVLFLFDEVSAQMKSSEDATDEKAPDGGQVLSFKQLESDDDH